jgi:hypothetical protein
LEIRAFLTASAAAALAAASVAFLLFGGRAQGAAIADLDQRVALISVRAVRGGAPPASVGLSSVAPLFPILSGPNAPPELVVSVEGVVRTPGRTAALLSIQGGPAQWFALGETRDGVTLEEVGAAGVTISTVRGARQLSLGSSAPPSSLAAIAPDVAPPGYRQPPEPASAPGADQ